MISMRGIGSSILDTLASVTSVVHENQRHLKIQENDIKAKIKTQLAKLPPEQDKEQIKSLKTKLENVKKKQYEILSVKNKFEKNANDLNKIILKLKEKNQFDVRKLNRVEQNFKSSLRQLEKKVASDPTYKPMYNFMQKSIHLLEIKLAIINLEKERDNLQEELSNPNIIPKRKDEIEVRQAEIPAELKALDSKYLQLHKLNVKEPILEKTKIVTKEKLQAGIHPKFASKEFVKAEPKLREFRDQFIHFIDEYRKQGTVRAGALEQPLKELRKDFDLFLKKNKTKDPLTKTFIQYLKMLEDQADAHLTIQQAHMTKREIEEKAKGMSPKERGDYFSAPVQKMKMDQEAADARIKNSTRLITEYDEGLTKLEKKLSEEFDVKVAESNWERFTPLAEKVGRLRDKLRHDDRLPEQGRLVRTRLAQAEVELEEIKAKLKREGKFQ
jgi:hypothetical protein